MASIQKRRDQTDLSDLTPPQLLAQDREHFARGIVLFNEGDFWASHEAWEEVWKRHPEKGRIFFQGLIQAAAGFHQLRRGIYHGAVKHLTNALWKLEPFEPVCLGLDIAALVAALRQCLAELRRLGEENLSAFDHNLIPTIRSAD